ncbi:hypothetical protein BD626DRAFT_391128 [Schizophyllum amplum]|uniref:GDP-fucose protein O-fucosyltransferase-domain-containing protein n=1 Tax=Schizophyllum amplum TaxID=97359 RepID=A0A550CYH6_9AGAR|nr:hypothetical protein BD626DRAFT_391128 [Auriculariopsis ampla]
MSSLLRLRTRLRLLPTRILSFCARAPAASRSLAARIAPLAASATDLAITSAAPVITLSRSRRARYLTLSFSVLFLCCYALYTYDWPPYALYEALERQEIEGSRALLINTETRPQRFVMFKQLQGAGFNNQVQEILLYHHLAKETGRTYVYQPFVWRKRGEHELVPLSAFLAGATHDSISSAAYDEICSEGERTHLSVSGESDNTRWQTAKFSIETDTARCLVVDNRILTWNFLASPGLHVAWPSYQNYLANNFAWSDGINAAIARTQSTLNLRSPTNPEGDTYMALHLRRGDFESHCLSLADSHTGFTTWATLPDLQNAVFAPPLSTNNASSVLVHCYPSLRRILDLVDLHARSRPALRVLHILHDAAWDHPLVRLQLAKLEAAVTSAMHARTAGWPGGPMRRVTHSGTLALVKGEADYAVAVDVELARRSEVFIGNGYSSLSAQIAALRLGADAGRARDIMFV